MVVRKKNRALNAAPHTFFIKRRKRLACQALPAPLRVRNEKNELSLSGKPSFLKPRLKAVVHCVKPFVKHQFRAAFPGL